MKRVVAFSLLIALFLSACTKDKLLNPSSEVSGQLRFGGSTAADGIGYYMLVDSTHETIILQNLPAEYKHADINVHVGMNYFDTGKTMSVAGLPGATGPRVVVIRSIRKL